MTTSTYPIYLEPSGKAAPSGTYLALFHGRDTPEEDMDDWGYNGPMIGPVQFVHTTYKDNIKVALCSDIDNPMHIEIHPSGCVEFEGKYYGDWTVYNHRQE